MTDMPADAQRSNDGQWWWDGSQWQPVTGHHADAAEHTPAAAVSAASEAVGQLSDDGHWRWDGTQWQPAQVATAGGSTTGAEAGRQVTLGVPTAEAHATHDGTIELVVSYSVTNSGATPIEARSLLMGFFVVQRDQNAESAAYLMGDLLAALAVGEEHHGRGTLQVDPGSRTIWVDVTDAATGESLATSTDVTFEVPGHQTNAPVFDDTQSYTLTLSITSVEHVADSLYRIHYDIQSDRDVPAGLKVEGRITGSEASSTEIYDLPSAISAGRSHAHYLTLEAVSPSHSLASIILDPGGPSEKEETVTVDVAEDGTPTMSR